MSDRRSTAANSGCPETRSQIQPSGSETGRILPLVKTVGMRTAKKTHSANILLCGSSQSDICQDCNMRRVFNGLEVLLLGAVYIEVPLFKDGPLQVQWFQWVGRPHGPWKDHPPRSQGPLGAQVRHPVTFPFTMGCGHRRGHRQRGVQKSVGC
jgi:hypothetical protein